jgi:hypothetical protein
MTVFQRVMEFTTSIYGMFCRGISPRAHRIETSSFVGLPHAFHSGFRFLVINTKVHIIFPELTILIVLLCRDGF